MSRERRYRDRRGTHHLEGLNAAGEWFSEGQTYRDAVTGNIIPPEYLVVDRGVYRDSRRPDDSIEAVLPILSEISALVGGPEKTCGEL